MQASAVNRDFKALAAAMARAASEANRVCREQLVPAALKANAEIAAMLARPEHQGLRALLENAARLDRRARQARTVRQALKGR